MGVILPTEQDWIILRRLLKKIDGMSGPGVANAPDSISINPPRGPASSIPVISTLPFFSAKIDDAGGTAGYYELTECKVDGSSLTGARVWDGGEGNLDEVAHVDLLPGGLTYDMVVQVYAGVDTNGDLYWWTPGTLRMGQMFPISLTQTGGSAGSDSAACSYTYTVKDLNDVSLGTTVNPTSSPHTYNRSDPAPMEAADKGMAYWQDNAGTPQLVIAWINEVPDTAACA